MRVSRQRREHKYRQRRQQQRQSDAAALERERLAADQKKIRGLIAEREAKEALKKKSKAHSGW